MYRGFETVKSPVNFQHRVSPASDARVLSDNLQFLYQTRGACFRSVFSQKAVLENSRSSLYRRMFVLERNIAHDRSTACARGACCTFSEVAKYPSHVRAEVIAFVLKTKARIMATVSQYHSWLETVSLLVTARAHKVRHIALFSPRDVASHSRRY